ncbi:Brefeldin A resistance protein [Hypsizygus marmoreus]|uniref:Brefeldin A resistance protein n=1 Tax=Hypsizygus marmoreus TaxID=39966 RepID=A0A369K2N1_HYPMA|nr:Brefeldin A resistance protein [Hypsizygus marmoreus]
MSGSDALQPPSDTSSSPVSPAPSCPTIANADQPYSPPKRNGSSGPSVSRVSIDSFDPTGVEQLRRTLSQRSIREAQETQQRSFSSSRTTLPVINEEGFDLNKTIRRIIQKRDEAHIETRELGVMFRDLHVIGIGKSNAFQPTFGSLFSYRHLLDQIQAIRHPPLRDILSGFEGVVYPGQMLLVLGRPDSGCTTLLKTLANMRQEFYSVQGEVYYDSISPRDIKKHFRGDVQYCPEDDIHFPTLTVDQTLKFAAKTRAPRVRIAESKSEYVKLVNDILITIFGLRHAKKTRVGDAAVQGVSGGEKKRVSIAEALATRSCMGAWDNSTRGLDASTALEYVQALRIATDTFNVTTIVSLYQAGESLYRHFDKVCVIYEGKMAYFGPTDQARQYFIDMGYQPAHRQTTADFLVAVTDPNGRFPRADLESMPRTADEFADYFKSSPLGALNRADMDSYFTKFVDNPERASAFIKNAHAEHAKHSRKTSPYIISIPMQARAVMLRRIQILRGNKLAVGLNFFCFVFESIIVGSIFLNAPKATSAYFSRGGVLFFALLFSGLTSMTEIPALYAQRPIVHRHKNAALYHPLIEAIALTLIDVPITFVTLVVFCVTLYFMVGLQRTANQFFIFFLFVFTMTITMKAWFRAVAAAFKREATAQTFAGVSILALAIYTGFTIPRPSMIGALRWITYINPLRYGFEAIMTNEFRTLNGACSTLVPQGPGYENVSLSYQVCTTVGSIPGEPFVSGSRFTQLSYGFTFSHTWMNFGIVLAFAVGFLTALLVFTEFNTATASDTSVVLFKRTFGSHKVTSHQKQDEEALHGEKSSPETSRGANKELATHPPMTNIFSWQHINYSVPIEGEPDKQLLSDVTGYVAPGKLTALIGESGSGKTTLLNVLASRVRVGIVTGDRFVNGQGLPADFQSQTAYCQQMDTHVPSATVREALMFSAKLRQPMSVPLKEKEAYVEKCLKMCELEEYGEAIVGSLGIEHRKRTTIAVELAAKPQLLLFLDEPTSGLDSQSAWGIMSFLRSLADNGQAILCTIHQPSAELFQVFDRMLLLRMGGETVYFGDLGNHATTLINYFERNGSRECLPDENPAEFMLDVIGAGATATSAQDWHEIWRGSEEFRRLQLEIDQIHTEGRNRPAVAATIHTEFASPWMHQVHELFVRSMQAYWRDPTYLMAKLTLNIIGGLFIGFTFWDSKNTQQGTQNKLFSIFMATIISVALAYQLQVPFINVRNVYEIRERPSRMYSWTALITSQILIEIPWNIVGSTLLFLCWFWTVGFESSRAAYSYLMMGVIFPLYYTTIGQGVAAMSPNTEIAALIFVLLFSFAIIFNGVLQPFRQLGWWKWMYHVTPYTYLIEGLLGQAIGHQTLECSPIEFVSLNPPPGQTCGEYMQPYIRGAGGYLTNPDDTTSCNFCSVLESDTFLAASFNIFYSHRWRNIGFLLVFTIFNIACIYLATYIFRIRTTSVFTILRRWLAQKLVWRKVRRQL